MNRFPYANLPKPAPKGMTPDDVYELRGYVAGLKPSGAPVITQADFATIWGVTKKTVQRWENGKTSIPWRRQVKMREELDQWRKELGTG